MWIQSENPLWSDLGPLFEDMDSIYSSLHSDDIWKKFEFLDVPPAEYTIDMDKQLDNLQLFGESNLDDLTEEEQASEIRHHDCMWAGHCGSKEHKPDMKIVQTIVPKEAPQVQIIKKCVVPPQTPNPSRSLLLKNRINIGNTSQTTITPKIPVGVRPDSPPSSDDDDHPRFKHELTVTNTLKLLTSSGTSECDPDEDSDLCEYFEDSDVLAGADSGVDAPGCVTETDHCYHKGKTMQMRMDHLGVQTPSDSEEEIDVVTIGEKTNMTRLNTVLPTNPTIRDRQKLQRTVACAISNKRDNEYPSMGGIKTRLPLRIPNSNTPPNERNTGPRKRNGGENHRGRGIKRPRHHRNSPHSKRMGRYGQSSDSETECSEKRSLHNNMERQRRVDLRNAFDDLRMLVPEVSIKDRAAKVVILREAASYCDLLTCESASMAKQVTELRRQQERLRARVSQLRRSLAAKR